MRGVVSKIVFTMDTKRHHLIPDYSLVHVFSHDYF